jgi:hypothetical protein
MMQCTEIYHSYEDFCLVNFNPISVVHVLQFIQVQYVRYIVALIWLILRRACGGEEAWMK